MFPGLAAAEFDTGLRKLMAPTRHSHSGALPAHHSQPAVSLWQLWFPLTVKIPPCEFRPHFVIHRPNTSHYRDGYIGKKPALCEQQPCPHRYNPLRRQDPDYLRKNLPADALILEASTDNYRTVLYSAHPPPSPSPPATPPPATDQPLPEESPQAFHSAESSPAPTAKTAKGYALPTDLSEESDTQETAVNPSTPQTPVEPSPALALDAALAKLTASTPVITHHRISGSGSTTPRPSLKQPIRSPLPGPIPQKEEVSSDAQRSDIVPSTSTTSQLSSTLSPVTNPRTTSIMADPTLTKLLQEQQRTTQLIQASLDKLTAAKSASTRSPVKEPEPFKGEPGDAQRFIRFFSNWAASNSELKDNDKKWISSALSYLQGNAGSWALQYLDKIAEHEAAATDEDKAKKPWPFGGKWSEFVVAFNKRFQPADQEKAAEAQLEALTQGKKSASQFAAEFMEVFPRTGLSQKDGMARFRRKLNNRDRIMLDLIVVTKPADSKPKTLQDYCDIVNENDFTFSSGSTPFSAPSATRSTPARDPFAMDIDATRVGPNGKSRDDFLRAMRGRCFGCGSTSHVKKDGNHGSLRCNYCQRMGHSSNVCQDKYMGVTPGQGLVPRRRIAATQEAPFSLFNEGSSTPVATTTIAATPSPPVDINAIAAAQQRQLEILAKLEQVQQDF
ncbi:hypothetical protein CC2G_002703 [Coprinopsis cinerea AmutBmut pab1-1]|nr:hypothetical protein CC2G_002703 [Coprinopsis cinerea AmutBmut pab1-1]